MVYIDCVGWMVNQMKDKYPGATIVKNECSLWVLAPGIQEALHNVKAPQSGENWKVVSSGYYHSVVEVW